MTQGGPAAPPPGARGPLIDSRYEILDELGRGGMGVVYRVRDHHLGGRVVALKRILEADDQGLKRFLREAEAIAALNHQNIRAIFDRGEDEDGPFLVMEYVEGVTLHGRVNQDAPLTGQALLELAHGMARGLFYAHRRGVIHRDVKPGNVLLTEEGLPKLTDFGLARIGRDSDLSMTGYGMGTPDYASPEQRRNAKSVDHRSDLYGLGATLYFAATGESPKVIRSERLPEGWRELILRCVEERPEARPFSAEEVLEDLEGLAGGPGTPTPASFTGAGARCPSCGAHNREEARFCRACGAGLFESCPKCGKEERVGAPYCEHCGVEIAAWKRSAEHLTAAREHLEEQRYGRAVKEAEASLEAVPGREEVQALLAEAKNKRELLRKAREVAEKCRKGERYEEGIAAWKRLLEVEPEHAEGKKAVASLEDAVREREFRRWREEVAVQVGAGAWQPAVQALGHLEEFSAVDKEACGEAAAEVEGLRQELVAREHSAALKAVEKGQLEGARHSLARLEELQAESKILAPLESRIREVKEDFDRHIAAARKHLNDNHYGKVAVEAEAALRVLPGEQQASRLLAEARKTEEMYAAAVRRATALSAREAWEEAESAWRTVVELGPKEENLAQKLAEVSSQACLTRARACLADYDYKKAVQEAERALEHDPGSRDAQGLLKRASRKEQALARARQEAEESNKAGRLGAALTAWHRVLRLAPEDKAAAAELARLKALLRKHRRRRMVTTLVLTGLALILLVGYQESSLKDARESLEAGSWDKAEHYVERILPIPPWSGRTQDLAILAAGMRELKKSQETAFVQFEKVASARQDDFPTLWKSVQGEARRRLGLLVPSGELRVRPGSRLRFPPGHTVTKVLAGEREIPEVGDREFDLSGFAERTTGYLEDPAGVRREVLRRQRLE
ncbi:MAG: protein kinase, partial [Planctomycetota bacterium]